jgi:hypothetical protein
LHSFIIVETCAARGINGIAKQANFFGEWQGLRRHPFQDDLDGVNNTMLFPLKKDGVPQSLALSWRVRTIIVL